MISINSIAKAQKSRSTVADPKALIKKLNKKLKKAGPPEEEQQYNAIKKHVLDREVAILKREFGIKEYLTSHQMRWLLINAYNEDVSED